MAYIAEQIANTTNGWYVIDEETGKKQKVFCNADANTAEDAIALIENLTVSDE